MVKELFPLRTPCLRGEFSLKSRPEKGAAAGGVLHE